MLHTAIGYAQGGYFRMYNEKLGKIKIISEGSPVIIKTHNGKKLKGSLKILNGREVIIRDKRIYLADIEEIRKSTSFLNMTGLFLLIGGSGTVALSPSLAVGGPKPVGDAAIAGSLIAASGILLRRLDLKHRQRNWTYHIVFTE
ncbi:MAG: hypothetical protein WBG48_04775 [Pricia sp.]